MRVDFDKLIKESGEKFSKRQLAREMFEEGLFKSVRSAEMTIQYHIHGRAKSCDWELLKYLIKRFKRKGSEIIEWDK